MPPKPNPVRVAPLGELNAYTVYEHELDRLASGSPGSNLLDLADMLLPFSGAFVIALLGTEIPSDRVYSAFLFTALLTGLAGFICLILALRSYQSNTALVAHIKGRMLPAGTPTAPASGGS